MKAFFLPMRRGKRFCLLHEPPAAVAQRGAVLLVHPFAEEMNQSRRMAALQSRAFAATGWTTLQLDLFGCGDSDGDFSEARWEDWLADVADASAWLHNETHDVPVLWGIRAGCLLAAQAAHRRGQPADLVLWQPVLSGQQHLRQFLRLKAISDLMGQTQKDAGTPDVRQKLERGETVEVAGYPLNPALASAMAAVELELPPGRSHVAWLEVSSGGGELSPASRIRIDALRKGGHAVESRTVNGPAFWQIVGSQDCPALIDATLGAMRVPHS